MPDNAQASAAEFKCETCGKRFSWKQPLAGRRVRCACGTVFRCPAEPPVAFDDEGLYEVAAEPPRAAVAPTPVAPAPALSYRALKEDIPAKAEPQDIKDLYMPLWLLAGGVVIELVAAFFQAPPWVESRLRAAAIRVGLEVGLGTALMLAGMLVAAKVRGIDLGRFWTAVFKLSAISVAPAALVSLFTPALNYIPFGLLIGWIGSFVLYFALLGALFDLEESDTWFCVVVIFLVKLVVYFALLRVMKSL